MHRTLRVAILVVLTSVALGMPGASAQPTQSAVFTQTELADALASAAAEAGDNPIVAENRRVGTDRWQTPWSGYRMADDVGRQVKGYATATSVDLGATIGFRVHASTPGTLNWNIYRLGWYGGSGGREVLHGSATVGRQPDCPTDASTGQIVCSWAQTFAVDVPRDWTSGIYVVVLTSGTYQNYVPFTVRDDSRRADLVGVQPVTTYQAYNNYPNDRVSGKSLYGYNSFGAVTVGGTTAAVKVSYDRPYAGHGASTLFVDAAPTVRYLEARGFDVKYATSIDLHSRTDLLGGVRGVVAFGHDEYYSQQMVEAVERARDAGTGLSWFGGNNVYWQVRLEADGRTMVCYRNAQLDPEPDARLKTVLWRSVKVEQPLLGSMWPDNSEGLVGPVAPWTVTNASHWFYRGTRTVNGTKIPGMVGVEADRRVAAYASPTGSGWTALTNGSFTTRSGGTGRHEATIYRAPSGAWVFNAGTINYPLGLAGAGVSSPVAQAMTTNLLARQSGAKLAATTARAAGPTRYDTAVAVSRDTFPENFGGTVHLATGLDFPDALGASAATSGQGPILLVRRTSVPTAVLDELRRLRPSKVVIVGDEGVVSDAVTAAVRSATGVEPQRAAGADRYGTGAALSRQTFAEGAPVAYVATGLDFPDALAGGAAGAKLGGPVLLTKPARLPAATLDELRRLRPGRIVVVGGDDVVSNAVAASLSDIAPTVRRAGPNRYATATAIANDVRGALGGGPALLATGADYPDALAAGPAAVARGGTLTLVPPRAFLPVDLSEELVRNDPDRLVAIGGADVVSEALVKSAAALFAPVPAGATVTQSPQAGLAPTANPGPSVPSEEARPETSLPWLSP